MTWLLSLAPWEHFVEMALQINKKSKDSANITLGTFDASNGNSKVISQTPIALENNSQIKSNMKKAEAENAAVDSVLG